MNLENLATAFLVITCFVFGVAVGNDNSAVYSRCMTYNSDAKVADATAMCRKIAYDK